MKKIYITVLASVLVVLSSCNKWLDVLPEDGLIHQEFFKTKEQLQSATIACYSSMIGGSSRPLVDYLFAWGELRGDMVSMTLQSSDDEENLRNHDIVSSNALVRWEAVYNTINLCNIVINNGPSTLESDQTLSEQQMKAYLAEAHGIRALMYFQLLRVFGEVPLRTEGTTKDTDIVQLAKSSREEVAALILTDLTYAEENAVQSYGRIDYNKGRLTRSSINAIQADVYLWLERYDDVLTACNKIIDSRMYGLVNGTIPNNWFMTLFYNGNSAESIFEIQFDAQAPNPFYSSFVSPRRFVANEDRVSDIFGVDAFLKDIRGERGSFNPSSNYMIWKYHGASTEENTVRGSNESYAHWFFYRYAEILLFKAEALVLANPGSEAAGTEALELINRIRTRGHAIASTAESLDPSNSDGIALYVLNERAREFAYEGKRWFDLLRFAKRDNYANMDILLDMIVQTALPEKQQTALAKIRDVRSHYLPIHDVELASGKLLIQNPYYQ